MAFELPDEVCIWLTKSWSGLVPAPTTNPVTSRSSRRFGFFAELGADEVALGELTDVSAVRPFAGLGVSTERSKKDAECGAHEHGQYRCRCPHQHRSGALSPVELGLGHRRFRLGLADRDRGRGPGARHW